MFDDERLRNIALTYHAGALFLCTARPPARCPGKCVCHVSGIQIAMPLGGARRNMAQ